MQIDASMWILEFQLLQQSIWFDKQSRFFAAFSHGAIDHRFPEMTFSAGKFGVSCQGDIRTAHTNQVTAGVFDDGDSNSLRSRQPPSARE